MSDVRTDGEKASALDEMETAIRNEGCSSISEMITKLNDTQANLTKAEEARDKFSDANKEASKIIGSKGGELGTVKQENKDLKATIVDLEGQLKDKGLAPVKPVKDPATEKTTEEQLSEVEKNLTEEHWAMSKKLLEAEEDDDKAIEMVENPAVRLKFLQELLADPSNKRRPTSFREPKNDAEVSSGGEKSDYERLLARAKGVTIGPSGKAVSRGERGLPERPRGTLT